MKINLIYNFVQLLFPDLCPVCNENLMKNEVGICLLCISDLPKTGFHLQKDNQMEKRFWLKVPIQRATSFFFFSKGSAYQKILHSIKYKGNKELAEIMGRYAAGDLMQSHEFMAVDVIVPVPLHPRKLVSRGYNQSEWIAKGISSVLNKPLELGCIVKTAENSTQTDKGIYHRYVNTVGIFDILQPELLEGKHVLLVDDVLTTGSTIESCVRALQKVNNVKVSVFTLSVA